MVSDTAVKKYSRHPPGACIKGKHHHYWFNIFVCVSVCNQLAYADNFLDVVDLLLIPKAFCTEHDVSFMAMQQNTSNYHKS